MNDENFTGYVVKDSQTGDPVVIRDSFTGEPVSRKSIATTPIYETRESLNDCIKVKYLDDECTRLKFISNGDWIDLYAAETVELAYGEFKYVHLGVAMQLPEGYEAHVAPRSSTFKKWGIIQANSVAVIDNSYCGDSDWWFFPAICLVSKDTLSDGRLGTIIHKGDKICQLK